MDERTLFDQFHEALDIEPRPGAYERVRFAFTNHPVALKRLPVLRMRWSKMGLRIGAVVTVAAIAIALAAVFIATHHAFVGSVPAGSDANVKVYQAMMNSDYNTMVASTSSHCNTIQDTGCQAAVAPVLVTLQKWVDDLNAFQTTPARYAAIDGQLRRHLTAAIAELNAAVAFQKANNRNGFNLAMRAAFSERAWLDPTMFAIEGTYPKVAGSYHDAMSLATQALGACVNGTPGPGDLGCQRLSAQETCTGAAASTCESDVEAATAQIQTFLVALLQNPAPSALTAPGARFQADLAQADTALLAIADALVHGDSAKAAAGQSLYRAAITAADGDAFAAANP